MRAVFYSVADATGTDYYHLTRKLRCREVAELLAYLDAKQAIQDEHRAQAEYEQRQAEAKRQLGQAQQSFTWS